MRVGGPSENRWSGRARDATSVSAHPRFTAGKLSSHDPALRHHADRAATRRPCPRAALANVGWCSPMAPSAGRPPDRREAGVSASGPAQHHATRCRGRCSRARTGRWPAIRVRAGVLGANNGLVSNLSLVAGVAGAPLETALETSASSKRNGARGCAHTPGRRPLSSARRCRLAIAPAPANRPGETRDEGDRASDGSAGGERASAASLRPCVASASTG